MSHAATKWAFDQPELHRDMKPSEWAVLMVLADCHNPVNGCFPSQDYICAKTNLGERAVRDQLARLRERGLIDWDIAREGCRRGSNRYRLGFEPGFLPAESAGRSTGKIEHRQPAESDSFNRQNLPPNPVREPVREPEREAREGEQAGDLPGNAAVAAAGETDTMEDGRAIERAFWRLAKDWPGFAGMPKEPARKAWAQLSPEDRAEAEAKFPHWLALLKAQRKSHVPAPSTYFGEKLWRDVPEPVEEKPTAIVAPPFGPMWMAARLKHLITKPPRPPAPLTRVEQVLVDEGRASAEALMLAKQVRSGWPSINAMHDRAAHRQGVTVAVALEALVGRMEPVPVASETYAAWRDEHERRGWPWLPDPGEQPVVFFPAGGPDGLVDFERALTELSEGTGDDGGQQQAAE